MLDVMVFHFKVKKNVQNWKALCSVDHISKEIQVDVRHVGSKSYWDQRNWTRLWKVETSNIKGDQTHTCVYSQVHREPASKMDQQEK